MLEQQKQWVQEGASWGYGSADWYGWCHRSHDAREGLNFFVMMGGIVPAIDSNARESHCAPSSVDRQRLCGGGVMEAGSVRTGMEPKIFTAGMSPLTVSQETRPQCCWQAGRPQQLKVKCELCVS